MNVEPLKLTQKRNRHVFARLEKVVDGAEYKFEMHQSGLVVWRKGSRKKNTIPFSLLVDTSVGQYRLPL